MHFSHDIRFRKETLQKLLHNILLHQADIVEALHKDFRKPAFETIMSESSIVISDLKHTIKNMESWARPKKVRASLLNFPSRDYIYSEPYGKVLVISPWNYPFQLSFLPLIAAVAAGNSVVLKPSELTPATSALVSKIIRETFDVKHVVAVLGDATIAADLLKKKWDYIFFTGSTAVGKIVAKAAAENLTPITLELGGKNPCIVDHTANLKLAARRIVWGKFMNAGQTCIAPDYLLVHTKIKGKLIALLQAEMEQAYGGNPEASPDFARIINSGHWKRLTALIEPYKILYGGQSVEAERYLSPTLIDEFNVESALMKGEIFGPILPILTYENEDDIRRTLGRYEKPLSLYLFTENKEFEKRILRHYSFGGGCINDTVVHFSNKRLPFGGVGQSGMGMYHGKYGFDTFSHKKSVLKKASWIDITIRYAPYGKKLKWIKRIMEWF
ncbi:aldehyde dehydrogenase [Flavobacterium pallidum]|uniref:Aldehyde dehydrogenase n=1 Tax=Flavobacterium pallidum TaxID=2172098 RepID=A0A2S1SIV1_9FLAO|nr:aldehyde dehydrogenase [Flavobacterium pallidum]AWI26343.1 aldehyde dehydrogenase [Flavobacterium pallidum]